jgi:2-desacetyl-2-hydroxyethyl bacteriochlorophyllide A dehydrogenase
VKARALYIVRPREVEIRPQPLRPCGRREVLASSELSAISAGTELLFYRGDLEEGVAVDTSLPPLAEPLRYPLRYGYCSVATIVDAGPDVPPELRGRRAFAFHPHQDRFVESADRLVPVPEGVSAEAACFLASMETAVSLVMDGAPVLGESVAVVGQGVVGLLVAALLSRMGVLELTVVDPLALRLESAETICPGVRRASAAPEALAHGPFDLVFELSGRLSGFQAALSLLRFEGRLVVGSWYGARASAIGLGTSVHRNRNTVLFSQVSRIDSRHAARFDRARRLGVALQWLARLPVEKLVTHRIPFEEAPAAFRLLDERPDTCVQVLLTHPPAGGE